MPDDYPTDTDGAPNDGSGTPPQPNDVTPDDTTPPGGEGADDATHPQGGEGEGQPIAKIGNHEFKTQEELLEFAKKNYGEVGRLVGELKKKQETPGTKPGTPSEDNQPLSPEQIKHLQSVGKTMGWDQKGLTREQIKAMDFFEENPEAADHANIIAAVLDSGQANDARGKPSYSKAWGIVKKGFDIKEKDAPNPKPDVVGEREGGGASSGSQPQNQSSYIGDMITRQHGYL